MTWMNKYSEIISGNIYKDIKMNNVSILIEWLKIKLTEYSHDSRHFIAYHIWYDPLAILKQIIGYKLIS